MQHEHSAARPQATHELCWLLGSWLVWSGPVGDSDRQGRCWCLERFPHRRGFPGRESAAGTFLAPAPLLHPAGALVPLVHGAGRGSARTAAGTVVACKLLASVSIALGLARAPFLVRGTWVILLPALLSGSCRLSACALLSQISSHVSPVCHTSSGSWRHRLQLVGRPREPTPFHAHPPPLCPGPSRVSVVRGCGWH